MGVENFFYLYLHADSARRVAVGGIFPGRVGTGEKAAHINDFFHGVVNEPFYRFCILNRVMIQVELAVTARALYYRLDIYADIVRGKSMF